MSNEIKKVFISYAWESDEFKKRIWDLAGWIQVNSRSLGKDIDVITDHQFSSKPPDIGWHRWMHSAIDNSDIVLIVCSPSYKTLFLGQDNDLNRGGFGVTYEGGIIIAKLVSGKGRNNKYYPILPDGGNATEIPDQLASYFNGLSFESGNMRILDLIIGENPRHQTENNELKESVTENENIIALESEINEEIIEKVEEVEVDNLNMNYDVQVVLRAYLSLNDIDKIKVVMENVSDFDPYKGLGRFDIDKRFLKTLDSNEKLHNLWNSINKVKKFEHNDNPFN